MTFSLSNSKGLIDMKWSALFEKLGKQRLEVTKHNDVTLMINGCEYPLRLKFTKKVKPYSVIDNEKDYYTEFDENIETFDIKESLKYLLSIE